MKDVTHFPEKEVGCTVFQGMIYKNSAAESSELCPDHKRYCWPLKGDALQPLWIFSAPGEHVHAVPCNHTPLLWPLGISKWDMSHSLSWLSEALRLWWRKKSLDPPSRGWVHTDQQAASPAGVCPGTTFLSTVEHFREDYLWPHSPGELTSARRTVCVTQRTVRNDENAFFKPRVRKLFP